ncbi:acetate/propionate family kinase [Rhodoferax sp. U11-2br]|uniref:acetate/propionate family kinase n=1 Tax=Rhodoferax sp. U11-2br TaxID=2838878 RepID=UPI001BE90411|nr:acetate/propionate family kinase [Rhodoferax sp. U11-2br]MBT3069128.1 acetate/propionate family kinase [Rhodoferax sp. U11-2br]
MTKHKAYLVLNAGSSSLKFSVFRQATDSTELQTILSGQIAGIGSLATFEAKDASRRVLAKHSWNESDSNSRDVMLQYLLDWISTTLVDDQIVAAGHRVVHGGRFLGLPMKVTPALLNDLEQLVPLAPLHQPHNLAPIHILARNHPELDQVACFDTAFHSTQPKQAKTYALPRALSDEGVCKYGFHGLSYEYVSKQLLATRPELASGHIVICHLGNGSSLCAVKDGRSMDTTMGFTALDGVPMGTRSGSIDPGVLLYLMREKKMDLEAIEDLLYRRSGLLGVSGLSNDMKVLEESNDPHAREAVDLFCFRVAKEVAAMAASMGGLDALVFTAGIGENSPYIRNTIAQRLAWLGVKLDADANSSRQFNISAADARVPTFVVPTNEEMMIAKHAMNLLAAA